MVAVISFHFSSFECLFHHHGHGVYSKGVAGFQVRAGGSMEPPKSGGGGWEKGSTDRHHKSVFLNSGAKGAENFFGH